MPAVIAAARRELPPAAGTAWPRARSTGTPATRPAGSRRASDSRSVAAATARASHPECILAAGCIRRRHQPASTQTRALGKMEQPARQQQLRGDRPTAQCRPRSRKGFEFSFIFSLLFGRNCMANVLNHTKMQRCKDAKMRKRMAGPEKLALASLPPRVVSMQRHCPPRQASPLRPQGPFFWRLRAWKDLCGSTFP